MRTGVRLGVTLVVPSASLISIGSTVKGSEEYCENIVTMALQMTSSLVRSVAVSSMNTFVVFRVIFE